LPPLKGEVPSADGGGVYTKQKQTEEKKYMFDEKTIKTLEYLSKINLTDEEKTKAFEFFDFWTRKFDMLENVDTTNTEPLVTVSSLVNVMRDDISNKMVSVGKLLENAPEQHDNYFVVPRIIE